MVISFIGMATQEVAIKPNLNITLKPDTETLEEVVVVAYGTAKKSSFTGSAATIKADKITKQQNSNVSKPWKELYLVCKLLLVQATG